MKSLTKGLLAVWVLSTIGCASLYGIKTEKIDQKLYDAYLTKEYSFSKGKCYRATIAALKEYKVGVKSANKRSGVIITNRALAHTMATASHSQYSSSVQRQDVYQKFYFKVSGNSSSCKVATTKYKIWINNQKTQTVNTNFVKPKFWDPIFEGIQEELEEGSAVSQK